MKAETYAENKEISQKPKLNTNAINPKARVNLPINLIPLAENAVIRVLRVAWKTYLSRPEVDAFPHMLITHL